MKKYTIGITTFSKRYDYIEKLLTQIRMYVNNDIIIIINGEKDGYFNEEYRKKILKLCLNHDNVYPIFYIETRGLSKMWNNVLINSVSDFCLLLNDDIEIRSDNLFRTIEKDIDNYDGNSLIKYNNSFSHFLVNKWLIDKVGYFDERLLGFGEEDGDICYRLLKNNYKIINNDVYDVINIVSNTRHDHFTNGIGKYSKFNRDFIYNKKYSTDFSSNYKGMFDTPMKENLTNDIQYPYELFFKENKNNL